MGNGNIGQSFKPNYETRSRGRGQGTGNDFPKGVLISQSTGRVPTSPQPIIGFTSQPQGHNSPRMCSPNSTGFIRNGRAFILRSELESQAANKRAAIIDKGEKLLTCCNFL